MVKFPAPNTHTQAFKQKIVDMVVSFTNKQFIIVSDSLVMDLLAIKNRS